jgi:hypothetical protein
MAGFVKQIPLPSLKRKTLATIDVLRPPMDANVVPSQAFFMRNCVPSMAAGLFHIHGSPRLSDIWTDVINLPKAVM